MQSSLLLRHVVYQPCAQISNNQEAIQSSKNEMVFYRHEVCSQHADQVQSGTCWHGSDLDMLICMQYIARQPQITCNKDAALSNLKALMEKELDRIDTLATAVHESKDKMKVSDICRDVFRRSRPSALEADRRGPLTGV
jgi:hypothetical protein